MAPSRGCTACFLKVAAIIGMTACHVATVFGDSMPFAAMCAGLALGGATFPIMAFLIVEGYRHTSDVARYAARLGVTALVSQVPYSLVFDPVAIAVGGVEHALPFTGNVLFTLLLGLLMLLAYDRIQNRAAFWALFLFSTAASIVLDWGVIGPVMILSSYVAGPRQKGRALCAVIPMLALGVPALADVCRVGIAALPDLLYELVGGTCALVLLLLYDGRRGMPLKWFFYAYYPAHLAVLALLS